MFAHLTFVFYLLWTEVAVKGLPPKVNASVLLLLLLLWDSPDLMQF